jgi:hypothetical protein
MRVTCTDGTVINYLADSSSGTTTLLAAGQTGLANLPSLPAKSLGLPAGNLFGELAYNQTFITSSTTAATAADNAAILAGHAGQWRQVVRKGQAATTDATWASFGDPVLNDLGMVAWTGTLDSSTNNTVLFCAGANAAPQLIARQGHEAAGCAGGVFGSFCAVVLPDGATGPIFTAALASKTAGISPGPGGVTTANDFGLWATDSQGALTLLLREGDALAGRRVSQFSVLHHVSGSPDQARAFNSNAELVVLVTFSDRAQTLLRITIP